MTERVQAALDDAIHALRGGDLSGGLLAVEVARAALADASVTPGLDVERLVETPTGWTLRPPLSTPAPPTATTARPGLDVERLKLAFRKAELDWPQRPDLAYAGLRTFLRAALATPTEGAAGEREP